MLPRIANVLSVILQPSIQNYFTSRNRRDTYKCPDLPWLDLHNRSFSCEWADPVFLTTTMSAYLRQIAQVGNSGDGSQQLSRY